MLKNVQALRALAALVVALSHLTLFSPAVWFLSYGTIGVELFFVISGFIMVYITNTREQHPVEFFKHRVVRVVPLYWLLTLAVFALAWFAPHLLKSTRADWGDLAKSLLFVPYVKHGTTLQPLLFQGWTLNYEMVFYLLFAASLVLRQQVQRVLIVSALIIGAVVAGRLYARLTPVLGFYTQPLMLCFALGMDLGLLFGKGQAGARISLMVPLSILVVAMLTGMLGDVHFLRVTFAYVVVTLALALERLGKVWAWGPIQLLGAASYSLYLVHPFAAIAVEKVARKLGLLDGPLLLASLAAATAAMIAAGIALYRWVELPLMRWGRKLAG